MLSHTRHPMLVLAMALLWLPMPTANAQPSNTAGPSFLFLSDIHLKTDATATAYGSDTGMDLWAIFLRKADSVLAGTDAPRFIVYTGDLPAHYNPCCYLSPDQRGIHNQNIDTILTGLRRLADKYNKPLFYMPGNNDGLAGDYTSFADEKLQTPFSLVYDKANPYPALNILPGKAKAPCMVSNPHPRMGYYAARPIEGLRLICLNSVIFSGKFEPVDNSNPFNDANTQLAWLAQQLAEAQKAREKVYLAMHIPPGNDAYNTGQPMWANSYNGVPTRWLHRFLNLVAQYQSTISGILYGHTHMDEVRRLYAPQSNKVTAVAISCPGVTPLHNNNPGFKTVRYHPVSKQLLDFTTYYTTPGATSWGNASYTFSDAYPGNGATIYQRLTQPQWSAATIAAYMANIYKVGNGTAQVYVIQNGIDVRANGKQGWNR